MANEKMTPQAQVWLEAFAQAMANTIGVGTQEDRISTGVWIADRQAARATPATPAHCCGASDFNPMLGDVCPACDFRHAAYVASQAKP